MAADSDADLPETALLGLLLPQAQPHPALHLILDLSIPWLRDPRDLAALECSRALRVLVSDHPRWRELVLRQFAGEVLAPDGDWKRAYREADEERKRKMAEPFEGGLSAVFWAAISRGVVGAIIWAQRMWGQFKV